MAAIQASTAVFAAAACASFGLAIRDTVRGVGLAAAPVFEEPAPVVRVHGGAPIAAAAAERAEAELAAEADAAFARAAAALVTDREAIGRAVASLFGGEVGPPPWLAPAEAATAGRIELLARLGIDIEIGPEPLAGGRAGGPVVAIRAGRGEASCAALERAAIAAWGEGAPDARAARVWTSAAGARAVLRAAGGKCELRAARAARPAGGAP